MLLLEKIYKAHCLWNTPKGVKQTKKNLYSFLDGFHFVDQYEIQDAVLEFCGIDAPSYAELIFADTMAEYYIKDRLFEKEKYFNYVLPF